MKFSIFISSVAHRKIYLRQYLTRATNKYEKPKGFYSLYQRISAVGSPNASMLPILDEYVKKGRKVDKPLLVSIIIELRKYRRFKHALEVSKWMCSKAFFPMTVSDAASRIHLIYKVQGLEQAESFFNNISQHIKRDPVYISLLNCYANERCVEKAEGLMQKIKELEAEGLMQKIKELGDGRKVASPVYYKVMMSLYYRVGDYAKLDDVMNKVKEEGFNIDKSALSIRMSAYAAASDAEGVNKIVMMLESDPNIDSDAITFTVAAHACLKVGLVEKSLQMIERVERLTKSTKKKYEGYDALLHFYSKAKKKDEFLRIWDLYKQETIFNKAYISMMRGLMMFDDIESMENIFQEWESKGISMPYDFRMADFLIEAYCRNGHIEKAEVLIEKGISRGGVLLATTWYYLAGGYITTNQLPKAVDALKKAVSICPHDCPLSKNSLSKCVEYLESPELRKTEEFKSFLEKEGLFSAIVRDKLFQLQSSQVLYLEM